MLDRRGEVREDASPRLAALRRQIRTVRDQLYRDLGEFVSSHKDELSEETIPMRGGRLVVVLQSGARGRSGGLVHGRSATGRSFYFEPLARGRVEQLAPAVGGGRGGRAPAHPDGADRRRPAPRLPALREHAGFLAELDLLQAAVRFGDRCGGALPEIGARHDLRLLAARHPLLDPCLAEIREEALGQAGHEGEIVPLDVELEPRAADPGDHRPQRRRQDGVAQDRRHPRPDGPVRAADPGRRPAAGCPSSRRWWRRWATSRTCWPTAPPSAAGCCACKEAWEWAGPDSLVLLDELGSGTDPEEGAALAEALLEGLLEKGSLGVITTHLAQLAAAALELPGASCAAMEFDPRHRPAHLPAGARSAGRQRGPGARPAGSGCRPSGCDRAEARLGSEHRDLRRLIAEVERVRQELAETRDRLEIERSDAEKLRRRLADERAALEEERRSVSRRR